MKNILSLIFLAISLFAFNTLDSQEWYPIGAKWTFNDQVLLPYPAHGIVKYEVVKDTIINDTIAKRIDIVSTSYLGVITDYEPIYVSEMNSKVFYWEQSHFKLMYDLTLEKGDTLNINNRLCDNLTPMTIDSVSSITVGDVILKVQYISYDVNVGDEIKRLSAKIIEVIGNEDEFLFTRECTLSEHFNYTGLRCFQSTGIEYRNPWWNEHFSGVACDSIVNGKDTSVDKVFGFDNFKVSPNPTNSFTKVSVSNQLSIRFISIYDVRGQLILTKKCSGDECQLDLSLMPNGVYFGKMNLVNCEVKMFKILKK